MISVQIPKMYEWQKPVYDKVSNDNGRGGIYVLKSRRQCGKSIIAEILLLYYAFKRLSISCLVEPTQSQCRRVFKQIIQAIGGYGSPILKSANATLLEIEFTNGSQIIMKSAEQGDNIRGLTVSYGILVIDEAAFIEREVFEILFPVVDATSSPVLLISTPLFEDGVFWEMYTAGVAGERNITVFDWAQYDTSALLPPEKLEYYRKTISPLKFQSEYLGQFIKEGSYLFGNVSACVGERSGKPAVVAGVDWGAGGTDSTVVVFMDADKAVTDIKRWTDVDPVVLVDYVAAEINARKSLTRVQVEKNSIGEVYLSMLKRKVANGLLWEFNTTNESKRRIIETLITAFQTGDIRIPNDAETIKQLQHFTAEKTPTGKLTYAGADGVHDDIVMALAMAYDIYRKKDIKFNIAFA